MKVRKHNEGNDDGWFLGEKQHCCQKLSAHMGLETSSKHCPCDKSKFRNACSRSVAVTRIVNTQESAVHAGMEPHTSACESPTAWAQV